MPAPDHASLDPTVAGLLGSSLADPQNRWVDIGTTKGALSTLRSSGINIRGACTWTVQADSDTGYLWQAANGVGGDILSHL